MTIRTIITFEVETTDAIMLAKRQNKLSTFKYCAPYTPWISEINIKEIWNGKNFNIMIPMWKRLGYVVNYHKTRETCGNSVKMNQALK